LAYEYIVNYLKWRLDLTTSLMGMVLRVHMLVWDLIDGEKLNKGEKELGEHPSERKYRLEHACTKGITFFEYCSYMFFFVHVMCGSILPVVEFFDINDRTIYAKNGWRNKKKCQSLHGEK